MGGKRKGNTVALESTLEAKCVRQPHETGHLCRVYRVTATLHDRHRKVVTFDWVLKVPDRHRKSSQHSSGCLLRDQRRQSVALGAPHVAARSIHLDGVCRHQQIIVMSGVAVGADHWTPTPTL